MKSFPLMSRYHIAIGILLGVCLALGGMVFAEKAEAQSRALGPFMIMQHSNNTATPGVFRVNQSTGYVSYCYVNTAGQPSVVCTAEVP